MRTSVIQLSLIISLKGRFNLRLPVKWLPGIPKCPKKRYCIVEGNDGISPDIWFFDTSNATKPLGRFKGMEPDSLLPHNESKYKLLGKLFGIFPVSRFPPKAK